MQEVTLNANDVFQNQWVLYLSNFTDAYIYRAVSVLNVNLSNSHVGTIKTFCLS